MRRRLNRTDWIAAALDAIAERGLAAVAVEPLATRLGVTKGSFYSHFASRDELMEATLEAWEGSHGGTGLAKFAEIEDPRERLRAVFEAAVSFSHSGAPSVHLNLIGETDDPRVRDAMARVTERRIELITRTYMQLGLARPEAADRARIAYAAYLGLLVMAREAPERRLTRRQIARLTDELERTLIASG